LLDETFLVRPCSPHVGVEISSIDITKIDDPTAASIKALLCAHGIVLIRNQRIERAARLKDYTRRFGELGLHQQFTLDGHPEIVKLSNIIENGAPFGLKDAGHLSKPAVRHGEGYFWCGHLRRGAERGGDIAEKEHQDVEGANRCC